MSIAASSKGATLRGTCLPFRMTLKGICGILAIGVVLLLLLQKIWYATPKGQAVFAVVAGLMVLQGFGALLLGKDAADSMVGSLAADLVRFVFKMLILPLRIVRRLLGGEP
jgi:hypothetical protein